MRFVKGFAGAFIGICVAFIAFGLLFRHVPFMHPALLVPIGFCAFMTAVATRSDEKPHWQARDYVIAGLISAGGTLLLLVGAVILMADDTVTAFELVRTIFCCFMVGVGAGFGYHWFAGEHPDKLTKSNGFN